MTHQYQPIACSLPADDAAAQLGEWADLRRDVVGIERLDRGIAMTFAADSADGVEDLAAREAACCSFLSITTSRTDDSIRLEITADDPAAQPVVEMLAGARER